MILDGSGNGGGHLMISTFEIIHVGLFSYFHLSLIHSALSEHFLSSLTIRTSRQSGLQGIKTARSCIK